MQGRGGEMIDRDDFWDLSDLVPPRKKKVSPPSAPSQQRAEPVDIRDEMLRVAEKRDDDERTLSTGADPICESYVPEDNPFLVNVEIKTRSSGYSFYGQFRRNAITFLDRVGTPCDYVPFFSYIPQYVQLTEAQRAYYFWFRTSLEAGEAPRADYSYFWLYIYEILNLPDYIPPKIGVEKMCRAWRTYRKILPKIDKFMTIWLADYCLMHRLPSPNELLQELLPALMVESDFKEFYLGGLSALTPGGVLALIALTSDYRYEKSRYATGENAAFYQKHLLGAMTEVFRHLFTSSEIKIKENDIRRMERAAFSGSLCAHNIKCTLSVQYHSFSGSERLRLTVTAAVKYTENQLRAYFAVKSRLTVPSFDENCKGIIDRYFKSMFDAAEKKRRLEARPEYEELYDAESRELSFDGAEAIERLSWENARLLVDPREFEEEGYTQADQETPAFSDEDVSLDYGLGTAEIAYLVSLLKGQSPLSAGDNADAVAERINEAFFEHFGDVILEMGDHGYRVIEDYIDEVTEWTERITGRG